MTKADEAALRRKLEELATGLAESSSRADARGREAAARPGGETRDKWPTMVGYLEAQCDHTAAELRAVIGAFFRKAA